MPTQPYLGQIMMVSFEFAPKGWAQCNGQILPINQNQALFSLLGTTYGGNGQTTFALPNLQGRVPIHTGTSSQGATYPLGQTAGEDSHTLVQSEMPGHTHPVTGSSNTADTGSPVGAFLASGGVDNFGAPASATGVLGGSSVAVDGGSQPHENRSPLLTVNFVIALVGIFPSRS
jgi:microcystin-dependent protein